MAPESSLDFEAVADGDLSPLRGSVIVLGVTGGIAAYKAVELLRHLVEAGAHVIPVLTEAATRFVGVTTFSALGSEPVQIELFDNLDPIPHTRLGQRADLIVVAPATARIIGEYAAGISADILGATLLATRAPVLVCPAMHTEMWEHPAVRANVATLLGRGVHLVPPGKGRLAGGDEGEGRLADVNDIVRAASQILRSNLSSDVAIQADGVQRDLVGVRVLVTAGGTREPIDPVRFLANRSSGRQGHAIAEAAMERGAEVVLVTAAELDVPAGTDVVRVETAAQLADAVLVRCSESDVLIMAAAVADFRPAEVAADKLHKADGVPELTLVPTVDILATVGAMRLPHQVLVGFAAETSDAVARGRAKLVAKGADILVVNDVTLPGVGFGHETNAVTILYARAPRDIAPSTGVDTVEDVQAVEIPLTSKRKIGHAVLDAVVALRNEAARTDRLPASGQPRAGGTAT